MGFTPAQMVDMLEDRMDYEDFCVLEEVIDRLFWSENETDRKKIIEKLRKCLNIECRKLRR